MARLNDNYCDCDDGSDEPGTSACSHTRAVFHCVNAGFFASDLPTSRVNDGVCDCCDASDEYASGAACPTDCAQQMESFRLGRADLIEQVEAGLRDRATLATEAQQLWAEGERNRLTLEASTASLRVMVEQLEARKLEEQRQEQEEKQRRVAASKQELMRQLGLLELSADQLASIVLEIARDGLSAKHELLPFIRKEREAASMGEEEKAVEKTPMEELDEAFRERDEERKKETRRIEKLLEKRRKKQEKKEKEEQEAAEAAAAAVEAGETAVEAEPDVVAVVEPEEEEEEELTLPEEEPRPIDLLFEELSVSERYEREEAVETRTKYQDTKKELTAEETKLTAAQKLMDKNYGVDHLLFSLRDTCVESEPSAYVYKMCFFGKATQDTTKLGDMEDPKAPGQEVGDGSDAGEDAAITEASEPEDGMETDAIVRELTFSKGQKCWNGPQRSLTVQLECGPLPMTLFDIDELQTCVYTAKLRTPIVCDEADRLGVMTPDESATRVEPHHIEIEVSPTL
ncbi:hypothetical protein BBJ28_00007533 [Nothophytophthora sp. Chile5]|nr:hypothetical protein BBJ28_00007533 [Nothophytophthora sp. Chile5]